MLPLTGAAGPHDLQEFALSSLATTVTLASSEEGGFHAPSLTDFFPPAILFDGTPLEFTRIQLVRVLAAVAVVLVFVLAARRARLVPGRFQSVVELILEFPRKQIAEEMLGKEHAGPYVRFITTVFVAVLAFNITGIIPFLNISGTSRIGLPLVLALWVYVMYLGAGMRRHGVGGFLKASLFPPNVPPAMYLLLTPIEFLQVFILRPATLAIRLMANMVAGHIILVLCFSATSYFLLEAAPAMKAFGALTFASGLLMTLFETFVAALQAYIFAVLTAVYISLSISDEH